MKKIKLEDFLEPYDIVITNNGSEYVTIKQHAKLKQYGNQEVVMFNLYRYGMLLANSYDMDFNNVSKDVSEDILSMLSIKEIYSQKYINNGSLRESNKDNLVLKWRRK